ncbi:MAG TPA: threonine ammonia-lyase, biosynthetic [Gammaproteobacteria bacterium]|nr:threonine ammonia-lyase, biosynthetic [Gammaproteobacteria bacterium]
MAQKYIEKILTARVYDVAIETPLEEARVLSQRLGNQILLKREDMQPVFSFKLRGAYNRIFNLTDAQKKKGVIAASAGNHAQGVALAGTRLGIRSVIVMPKTTPDIKVAAVRHFGGKAVLHGDSYDDAQAYAWTLAEKEGLTFIHPFDDPDVIAGQGTVGMEIVRQHPDPVAAIFVPVGGGGLISGVASFIKYLRPEVKIIGVEPEDTPTFHEALKRNRRVTLKEVGLFADGVAVRQMGKENWRLARQLVDEVILISTDEMCAAIKDIFEDTRTMMEPAGALAVAAIKKYVAREQVSGETLIAINSGANINFERLRHVTERAELGEKREALLGVTIPEKPGSFRTFCKTIGNRGITEFNYRYSGPESAQVFAGIKLSKGDEERQVIVTRLEAQGYQVVDMTENEVAKVHLRYMVGGHGQEVENEQLYRFMFPERPGALLRFLTAMGKCWNISLFHYRNHGAAFGRILVGIQVPPKERRAFTESLDQLGYQYWNESENPVYRLFLS